MTRIWLIGLCIGAIATGARHSAAQSSVPDPAGPFYDAALAGDGDAMERAFPAVVAQHGDNPVQPLQIALSRAALSGSPGAIRWTLDRGADPNVWLPSSVVPGYRGLPLANALASGSKEAVELLLSAGASVTGQVSLRRGGPTPLLLPTLLSTPGNGDAIAMLLSLGMNPDHPIYDGTGSTRPVELALALTDSASQIRYVSLLMTAGASAWALDPGRRTPIVQAAITGRRDLLDAVALSPEAPAAALRSAARAGTSEFAGVSDGNVGRWLLVEAIAARNAAAVDMLLSLGVDPGLGPGNGVGALHVAAAHGPPEAVRRLLDAGASVDGPVGGLTPLHLLTLQEARSLEVEAGAALLIEAGADPDHTWRAADKENVPRTPLAAVLDGCSVDDRALLTVLLNGRDPGRPLYLDADDPCEPVVSAWRDRRATE